MKSLAKYNKYIYIIYNHLSDIKCGKVILKNNIKEWMMHNLIESYFFEKLSEKQLSVLSKKYYKTSLAKYLFIVLLFSITLQASHVQWRSNYENAHQEALEKNKTLMVFLIQKNCAECQKMLTNTFLNQKYINKVNENFVSVIVTKGQRNSYPIEMLYTMTYPALFFLNKEELFVGNNLFGYISPDRFKTHLELYFK